MSHHGTTRALMVLGCTSGAGKSWLATALCRIYARKGHRVAPFKAQNMSNHSRIVAGGEGELGEIGSAQYFQALAAGVEPDVRMNPVLLKPEADTRSQVVVNGRVRAELSAQGWRERASLLAVAAEQAYRSLSAEHDLMIIEGAGSPAEINLMDADFVNTGTARFSRAACLLVADIDRGGAFAHLFGTHTLMDPRVRDQVRGFVLNRFRGDPALLSPAPEDLESMTGVPTLAVVPWMRDHGLPEEDAVPQDSHGLNGPQIVVVAAPHASNLDEFEPLRAAGARLSFARDERTVAAADWLILPGSKQTRADLDWLRARGIARAIQSHIAARRPVLAICGGLQLLGERLEDPDGLDGGIAGTDPGLGVLPLVTHFDREKHLSRARARFGALEGFWGPLSDLEISGYELHLGRTQLSETPSAGALRVAMHAADSGEVLGWQGGSILAVYLHGLFEDPRVVRTVLGSTPTRAPLDFDQLADHVEASFAPGALDALVSTDTMREKTDQAAKSS
jgi:adenosylcobyric acid synthase